MTQNTAKLISTIFSSPVSISDSSGSCRTFGGAIADLGPVDARDLRRQNRLDRGRQMVIETGLRGAVVGAKAQHDPDLVGQHPIETARQPDDDDRGEHDGDPGAGAKAAGQYLPHPILAAPQPFLKIGGRGTASGAGTAGVARAAAPRTAATGTAAPWTAPLTYPDHRSQPFLQCRAGS